MRLGHISRLTSSPSSDVILLFSQNIKTLRTLLLHVFHAILTSTLALARNALFSSRLNKDWMLKDWVHELISGCCLHHFNLSGIDISLLNN